MQLAKREDVAMRLVLSAHCRLTAWRFLAIRVALVLASALALGMSVGEPPAAFAHAVPVTTSPVANAILGEAPRDITIRFSERVEPRASVLEVVDARGSRIDGGHAAVAPGDPWLYRVTLQARAAGIYTVSWRVMSADDGHVTEGAYVFVVGEAAALTSPLPGRATAVAGWLDPLARWVELVGAVALLGALTAPLVFRRQNPSQIPRASVVLPWTGAIVLGEGITLFAKARQITSTQSVWVGLGSLLATTIGRVGAAKVALTVLLVGLLVAYWRAPGHRQWVWPVGIAFALLILLSNGLVSHSSAIVELRGLAVAAQMVHLLGMALWVGGLGYFATLFWWGVRREWSFTRELAWAIPTFSLLASGAVGLLTLSGVYLARLHLGSSDALVSTLYGRILLAKLGLAAVMGGLGGYHQFVVHRRILADLDYRNGKDDLVSTRFRRTLRLETLLGLMTLLVAAFLGTTSPAHMAESASAEAFRQERQVDDAKLVLEIWPLRPGLNTVRLRVTDREGQPLSNATAALLQLLPTQIDVGPVAVRLEQQSPGVFIKTGPLLGMEGQWRGRLTIQRQGAYDLNHRFELVLPGWSSHHRHDMPAAPVDVVTGLVAIGIVGVTALLLSTSRRKLRSALQVLESTDSNLADHLGRR
jgi:copper transport protein